MLPISFSINSHRYEDSTIEPRFFTLAELTRTGVAFLDNHPKTFTQIANLRSLAEFLDMLRDELGHPIFVNSAFRSAEVNAQVGGAPRSLHKQGRAADIWTMSENVDSLIEKIRNHRNELSEFIVNKEKHYIHIAI